LPQLELLSFENLWYIDGKLLKPKIIYDGYKPYELINVNQNHNVFKKSSTSWSNCYLRKFLIDNNLFYPNIKAFGEDLYFHILVFSKAKSIYLIEESLYVYRRYHKDSFYTNTTITDKLNGLLDYAFNAYDCIKNDNSNVSKHYAIFFKFLRDHYILSFIENEKQKATPWFAAIKEKYSQYYNRLLNDDNLI
jgi:hypothetical protein